MRQSGCRARCWSIGIAWALGLCFAPVTYAQETGPGEGLAVPVPAIEAPVTSLEQLRCLSWEQMECLYRNAPPGPIPTGYYRGIPLFCPDRPMYRVRTSVTERLWLGKDFNPCGTELVNQWCAFRAVRAKVSPGCSWMDGCPSVIMDYWGTALIWFDMRDEIRLVGPGIYLGASYLRRPRGPKFNSFFALQACPRECAGP